MFCTFCYNKYPQFFLKKLFFSRFRPICILHSFVKKKKENSRNKCILIGLRKSYSIYKIGDRFMAFFFTSNGGKPLAVGALDRREGPGTAKRDQRRDGAGLLFANSLQQSR